MLSSFENSRVYFYTCVISCIYMHDNVKQACTYLTFGGENFLIWKICLGTESHEVSYCKHNDNTTPKNQYFLQNFSSNEIIYLRCILYQTAFDAKPRNCNCTGKFYLEKGAFPDTGEVLILDIITSSRMTALKWTIVNLADLFRKSDCYFGNESQMGRMCVNSTLCQYFVQQYILEYL